MRPSSNASDVAMSDAFAAYWPHQPGKDIGIVGSGALLRSLLAGEPLDELGLMVHPLVLGSGKRLLGDGSYRKALKLVDSKTFGTGVLYLTYRPAGE